MALPKAGLPPRRRHGVLSKAGVLLLALCAIYLAVACLTFALPAGKGRPTPHVTVQKSTQKRARDDMPRQSLEIPEEVLQDEIEIAPEPIQKRVPYTMSFFVHGGDSDNAKGSANWKYMQRKLQQALEHAQDWIVSVDVRLTIENHAHKAIPNHHKTKQEGDDGLETISGERKQLAPYRFEVSVKMQEGMTLVLSKPKHAQATFIEAVDHMYDELKRMMRKEKEKRIANIRHSARKAEFAMDDERISEEEVWAKSQGFM